MHAPNQDSWGIHGGSSPAAPESGAGWYPRPMPPMANPPPELLSPRRALIAPAFGVSGVPWGSVGRIVTSSVVSCGGFWVHGGYGLKVDDLLFMCAAITAFVTAVLIGRPVLHALRLGLAVDEGGVRCSLFGFRTYYPFALVGPGGVGSGGLDGLPKLILQDRTGRPFVRLPLVGSRAEREARELLEAYEARRADLPAEIPRGAAHLERRGRALGDWLGALDTLATALQQGGYRAASVDADELAALCADNRHAADLRAAAAYVLLKARAAQARELVSRAAHAGAPPILLLLARLAAPGDGVVHAGALEAALPYLDEEDAAAALPAV